MFHQHSFQVHFGNPNNLIKLPLISGHILDWKLHEKKVLLDSAHSDVPRI